MVIAKTGNCFFMNNKEGAVLNGWDEHHSIWMRKGYDNASDVFDIRSYGRIRFFTGGLLNEQKERLSILNNGFVGIGTSVPTNILTIENNNNNPSIQLNGASPGWGSGIVLNNTLAKSHGIYSGADGSLHIASSGKDNLVIKDNGDVHIMGNLLKNGAQVDSIAKFSIIMWYGDTVPNGWAECNGQNGTPDLRGRFPLGEGQGANLTNRPNKSIGGAETHKLTIAEMPRHSHRFNYPRGDRNWTDGTGNTFWGQHQYNNWKDINPAGDDQPHNNMPPFLVFKFIMKL
jgi:microcystin-dependent protein